MRPDPTHTCSLGCVEVPWTVGRGEQRTGVATALTPSPLCDPLPCPSRDCEPSPSMVLLALLLPVPPPTVCCPSLGSWCFFFFFFQGEGGEEGGKSKILSQRWGKVRFEKGQKAKVVPSSGGVVWSQALNIILLKNLSGENKSRGAKEGATRVRGRTRDGILGARVNGGIQGLEVLPGGGGNAATVSPPSLFHPSSSPGLFFSSLSPTTEAVALAMSSCSGVPCMFPTLHPLLLRGPHYNKF